MSAEKGCSNDNVDPKVDTKSVVATASWDDQSENATGIFPKSNDLDDDDYFVCRKCDKVFKDLSKYLEHKIQDENYRISHARSKVNKRLIIPQLVEKKRKAAPVTETSVTKDDELASKSLGEQTKVKPVAQADDITKNQNCTTDTVSDLTEENPIRQKGKKRKSEVHNDGERLFTEKENSCHLCDRKFRRAATLRWHLKYDHKTDDDDDSDSSEYDTLKDNGANHDEDFKIENVQEQDDDHDLNENDKKRCADTEQSVTVTPKGKKLIAKADLSKTEETNDRPYVCETCGRGFKELPVYKAHSIVHSEERKFVCPMSGCPYGFKTKGCLVRHMRRHTGERPFECDKCGRAFAESGALSRHLKARRNCAVTPDNHYPRYRKRWSYHPNIEAVIDQEKRETDVSSTPYIISNAGLSGSSALEAVERVEIEGSEEVIASVSQQAALDLDPPQDHGGTASDINLSSNVATSLTVKSHAAMDGAEDEMAELRRNSERTCLKETQCHVCLKDYPKVDHLEMHLHSHLAFQPTTCGFCHFLATSRDEMLLHVQSLHADSLTDDESFVFAMQGEESKKDGGSQTTLREALIAVKQLYLLKSRKGPAGGGTLNPSTAGSLECLVCHKTFKGMTYMRQHMRMHTGDRPYKCDHCDSRFTSRDVLKKHMYVHMDQRDFKCGECGKMFKRLAHVQQHIRIHTRNRVYVCTICEKLFKTHNSLKVHLRTHTNINPYKCGVCNRQFRERGSLQRHMRLHTGEKPFSCPHCNRRFAEQGTLSRHLKAKVPCSVTRDADLQSASSNTTMLAQFSSVVADTQEYILPAVQEEEIGDFVVLKNAESDPSEVMENVEIFTEENLPESKEAAFQYVSEIVSDGAVDQVADANTETLQIYDATTGESLFITGDKSVIEMVKIKQLAMESTEGFGLDKIREMLLADIDKETPVVEGGNGSGQQALAHGEIKTELEVLPVGEELEIHAVKSELEMHEVEKGNNHMEHDPGTLATSVVSIEDVSQV